MKRFVLKLIKFYQRYLSIDHAWAKRFFLTDKVCRYTPTCSEYTYQAVEKYGAIRGLGLGFRRVLRCHPWSKGGFDPVR